jgi:hypothetical protein
LTGSILQEARIEAKAQLFGVAEDNVKFAEGMKSELEKEGHVIELVYTNRKDTLKNIERLVVGEELIRLKNETNGSLCKEERRQFGASGRRTIMPCSLISSDSRHKIHDSSTVCSLLLPSRRQLFPSYNLYSRLMRAT